MGMKKQRICKQCNENPATNGPYCSYQCRDLAAKERKKAKKLRKQAEDKAKGIEKQVSSAKLEALFVKIVRLKYGYKCAMTGKLPKMDDGKIIRNHDVHHVCGRRAPIIWLVENGILLCVHKHLWDDDSAHAGVAVFREWVKANIMSEEEYNRIRRLGNSRKVRSNNEWWKYLKEEESKL